MCYQTLNKYIQTFENFSSLSTEDIQELINQYHNRVDYIYSDNEFLKNVFYEIVNFFVSESLMSDERFEMLLRIPSDSILQLQIFLQNPHCKSLLTQENLALILERFQQRPDDVVLISFMRFVEHLSSQKLLTIKSLTTALSIDASNLWWKHHNISRNQRFILDELLNKCTYLYEDEIIFQHTINAFLSTHKGKLMGIDKALKQLYQNKLLSCENISLLISTEEKYGAKAEGIKFLHEKNLLSVTYERELYFGKFGKDHFRLIQLLDRKNLLDETLVRLMFKARHKEEAYSGYDISLIHLFFDKANINEQRGAYQVILDLLMIDDIRKCSLLDIIKISLSEFTIEPSDWTRLEAKYSEIFKPNVTRHNLELFFAFSSAWEALKMSGYNKLQVRTWLLEGQIDIISTYKKNRSSIENELLISIINRYQKLQPEQLKALLLSTRLEGYKENSLNHPLANLWDVYRARPNHSVILAHEILFKNLLTKYILPETYDEVHIKSLLDLCCYLHENMPQILRDEQKMNQIVAADNLYHTCDLIQNHVRSHDVEHVFDGIFLYRENFIDDQGNLLNVFADLPRHMYLTLDCWQSIFIICQDETLNVAQRQTAIARFIAQWFHDEVARAERARVAANGARQIPINSAQSTHTASVHMGTNITMWLMSTSYKQDLMLATYNGIKKMLAPWEDKKKNDQLSLKEQYQYDGLIRLINAQQMTLTVYPEEKKRCLEFIEKENVFPDESIKLKLKNSSHSPFRMSLGVFLLSLYNEIMEAKESTISDEDVLAALLKAGYETIRGYNINEKGIDKDLHATSKPMCTSGSFNKLCEIFSPFSKNILFYFVTDKTIMEKMKCLSLEHFSNYIDGLCLAGRLTDAKKIMDDIEKDGLGSVLEKHMENWDGAIEQSIRDEFENFKNQDEIDKVVSQYKVMALPFYDSPLSMNAEENLTPSFVNWFKSKRETLSNAVSVTRLEGGFFSHQDDESLSENTDRPHEGRFFSPQEDEGLSENTDGPKVKRQRRK